jgi:hypothetical protein
MYKCMKILFVRKRFVNNVCTNFYGNVTSCFSLVFFVTDGRTDRRLGVVSTW